MIPIPSNFINSSIITPQMSQKQKDLLIKEARAIKTIIYRKRIEQIATFVHYTSATHGELSSSMCDVTQLEIACKQWSKTHKN